MTVRRCAFSSSGDTTRHGRVFRISLPRVGSRATRNTSPRRGGLVLPLPFGFIEVRRCRRVKQAVAALHPQFPGRLRPSLSGRGASHYHNRVPAQLQIHFVGQTRLLDQRLRKPYAPRVPDTHESSLHRAYNGPTEPCCQTFPLHPDIVRGSATPSSSSRAGSSTPAAPSRRLMSAGLTRLLCHPSTRYGPSAEGSARNGRGNQRAS